MSPADMIRRHHLHRPSSVDIGEPQRAVNRVLSIVSIFVLGALAALAILGYFAYLIATGPPEEQRLNGLAGHVDIQFTESGTATISARSMRDAVAGLGYAEAATQTWPLVVYRAAATGRMTDVAGKAGQAVDTRTVQLGISELAREVYDSLDARDRDLLDAFADGVNRALSTHSIQRDPSLVLSGYRPERWEPWHTVAVERLFAWLAAHPADGKGSPITRPVQDFLHIHDLDQSMIVTSEKPAEPGLFVRYVWGSTALPTLFEASLLVGERLVVRGTCLTGTPFFLAGRSAARAWAFLLDGTFRVDSVRAGSAQMTVRRRVLRPPDGTEHLVSIVGATGSRVLGDVPADSSGTYGTLVSWAGLISPSDATSWLGMLRGEDPTYRLIGGTGVVLTEQGVAATPNVAGRRLRHGRLISLSPFESYVASRIDTLMASGSAFYPRAWFLDTYSPWASEWNRRLVEAIGGSGSLDGVAREAHSYLRNWDSRFDGAGIGASIFEAWAEEWLREFGDWPGAKGASGETSPDSSLMRTAARGLLRRAVGRLTDRLGADLSVWRWENVNAAPIHFPILGQARASRAAHSRYAPRYVPGSGHPSAPNWSSVGVPDARRAARSWEGWTRMTVFGEWAIRRWNPDATTGVGSGRAPNEASTVLSLSSTGSRHTRLLPAAGP